jgi:hypothetical protein
MKTDAIVNVVMTLNFKILYNDVPQLLTRDQVTVYIHIFQYIM